MREGVERERERERGGGGGRKSGTDTDRLSRQTDADTETDTCLVKPSGNESTPIEMAKGILLQTRVDPVDCG